MRHRLRAALRGRYEVRRQLGAGGMALVFLAQDVKHDRPVAVKVLITELNTAIGTPQYMSPEQLQARRDLDNRTDLYSLGCVLFEMLAGAPPYDAPTFHGVVAMHLGETVPHVSERCDHVPAHVDEALFRVLAKRREDRFQHGESFVRALMVA